MLNRSIRALWSYVPSPPEPAPPSVIWDSADHDMVVRYAIVGIFLLMLVGALWHAKPIAMPLVAGSLLGLMLGPVIDRMVRAGIPQTVSATLLVMSVAMAALALLFLMAAPIALWADQLPGIVQVIRRKLAGMMTYAQQLEGMAKSIAPPSAPKVSVEEGSIVSGVAAGSSTVATGLLLFFATVFAYLATRRHLKARILRLCLGRAARASAGNFLEEIERRMATYFGVLTLVNLGIGVTTWLIAWMFGLSLGIVWGVVAFIMNFVPIIGPVIVAVLLFAAGLLDDGQTWSAAAPALVYYLIHLIEANIITPYAVGRRLTLSPFLVLLSFVFWLWLWGPIGAILSTPILLLGTLAVEVISTYRAAIAEEREDKTGASASLGMNETLKLPEAALQDSPPPPSALPQSSVG
jgi:predicted PurR-regulated permease PerM